MIRSGLHRLRMLATWQVAGPIVAYALTALLVGTVVEAFVARQQAYDSQQASRTAASRRIDKLQQEIGALQDQLRRTQVRDARERGRLEDAIAALAEQIRQMGGSPVTNGQPQPQPALSTNPRPTSQPSPSPTADPSATPTPSPTRTCVLVICIR